MSTNQSLKRMLLGRTMATGELEHTLLPKVLALPVFSSDPLSSNAYATQEILLVLGAAGSTALGLVQPVSFAVAILLATVVASYRQTVRAYPNGGGAYIVAHENLGTYPGLLAAAALLIDYVLTVSVSITAGVDAITSAVTGLTDYKIEIAVGFVAFVTLMNLRGTKESGTLFAIPTYGFVISIYLLLGTGFVSCLGGCPIAESAGTKLEEAPLTLFLILRAFSAGTTALTGVEAVSNGVPAFRYPQSENAAKTLTMMGVMSISMFLGLSWLADQTQAVYTEESQRTVVAEIAHTVFGGGFMFYVLQVMTAGILILAANTAYQDFPRLSSILAQDRFMPRQFMNRGDRLVFSNGIVILAVLASLLIVVLRADLNRLIQLYLVGVFISFTLSQGGMVVHWRKTREPGWKHRALINGFGSFITGVVFFVVVTTKFIGGAWVVVAAIPVIISIMASVNRHYSSVGEQLAHPEALSPGHRMDNQHFVILVSGIDAATTRAVGYARAVRPRKVTAVTFDRTNALPWERIAPEIPLRVLDRRAASMSDDIKAHLRIERTELPQHDFLTLVVPEILDRRGLVEILRRPSKHRLKASLLGEPGIQVLDIPIVKEEIDPDIEEAHETARNYVVVLVAGVHKGTLQAIRYGESLRPTDIRAVSFGLDPAGSEKLGNDWIREGLPLPLEIEDAPFREVGSSLTRYVQQFRADGRSRIVTVVIPEFVVRKRWHQVLHGQTALVVKRHLLFEGGVVVASVPYRLER